MLDKKDLIAGLWGSTNITIKELKKLSSDVLIQPDTSDFFYFCRKHDINYLVWNEIFLKKTRPLPYVLFYKWDLNLLNRKIIWIVWPRKINSFIKRSLEKFFEFLKWKDVVVVSWLADWTDSYAHKLSLENNIPTIAVLWFWFEYWLNSASRNFIEKISTNWLVLSEFKLKQGGTNWTFPQRNRIIAWISDFLFVPQAAEKSWTLITVNKAIEYWINVYSLFSSYSDEFWKGTNKLIAEWKINGIYDFETFFKEISKNFWISSSVVYMKENLDLTENEKIVIDSIKKGNNTLELLQNDLDFPVEELLNILSMLELNWLIISELDKYFIK